MRLLSFFLAAVTLTSAPAQQGDFPLHAFHKKTFGGGLDCTLCHVPVKEGSVALKRPGHDQCRACHDGQAVCAQCHSSSPAGAGNLLPFPRYKPSRALLSDFSHAKHMDPQARIDAKTGFRADCTTCHPFESTGVFATFPTHRECALCHAKPGFTPRLGASMRADDCRACHTPEEIEDPSLKGSRGVLPKSVATGQYDGIKFSHAAHFQVKDQFNIDCTTCHHAIPLSTGLANLTLPVMLDCVQCHDTSRAIPAAFRMSNCATCHTAVTHAANVKPASHTEKFRAHHETEAGAADATCFVCHRNVSPSLAAKNQCNACHQVMLPENHTARWKDDLHGEIAALDRTACATCHTADYCSACHNELPRSHVPLPMFKAGGHALQAMLDQRACLTCHTFQNTCSACHTNKLR